MTLRTRVALLVFAALAVGACGRPLGPSLEWAAPLAPATTTTTAPPVPTFAVATVHGSSIPVFANPGDAAPMRSMSNPNEDGQTRLFLVTSIQPDWLQVLLPIRPNGSKGWIRAADVILTQHQWRIVVELDAHRITVWNGPNVFLQEPVGVGRGSTPTPGGEYYITEMLRPPDPSGPYGPYAFGLSAFSDVLTSFAGGDGVVGLHGTNDPSGLGHDVSHGCIRLSNASITKLVQNMPLGTPVSIVA